MLPKSSPGARQSRSDEPASTYTSLIAPQAPSSVADLLPRAAERAPDAGLWFQRDEAGTSARLGYKELLRQARRVQLGLEARGLERGDCVVLRLDSASEFLSAFWGALLGGFVPCALAPLPTDPARAAATLRQVSAVVRARLFVTSSVGQEVEEELALPEGLAHCEFGRLIGASEAKAPFIRIEHETALLVLTSGSTGTPKAVALSHENLLASLVAKQRVQQLGPDDVSFNWVSFDHVAALIECHLFPLFACAEQVHVSPALVLREPLQFLKLISRFKVSMTFTPNFLLGLINDELGRVQAKPELALHALRHVVCGGEAIVRETALAFLNHLAPSGLRRGAIWPAFGMTETCAGCIYNRDFPGGADDSEFASLGIPIEGLEVRIVDEFGRRMRPGVIGELEVRGPMVFTGYLNNFEATMSAFTEDGWFRTGDRGSYREGRLALTGRSKDSIIVRGVNYPAHELEVALERLEGIRTSFTAVFPTRAAGSQTEQVAVAFVPRFARTDARKLGALVAAIRQTAIAEWSLRPEVIVPLDEAEVPKTSLGKIQRVQLRKNFEAGVYASQLQQVESSLRALRGFDAPLSETESRLVQIFGTVLSLAPNAVSATANFFDLGGTSLDIWRLKHEVDRALLGRPLLPARLLRDPSPRGLAAQLAGENAAEYEPLVTLTRSGEETPLFCVHPGVGEILVFVSLAKYFMNDRPVHALRARGFGEHEVPFQSFEELVDAYHECIVRQQPQGPYALLGYSFGGVVAFELAKRLERAGQRVALVGVINAPPHIAAGRRRIDFKYTAINLAFLLSLVDRSGVDALHAENSERTDDDRAGLLEQIVQRADPSRMSELDLDGVRFERWVEIAYSLVELGRSYQPSGSVRALTVFYAAPPIRYQGLGREQWLSQYLRAWDEFSREPVSYVPVAGEHHSLMAKHVGSFATTLRTELLRG